MYTQYTKSWPKPSNSPSLAAPDRCQQPSAAAYYRCPVGLQSAQSNSEIYGALGEAPKPITSATDPTAATVLPTMKRKIKDKWSTDPTLVFECNFKGCVQGRRVPDLASPKSSLIQILRAVVVALAHARALSLDPAMAALARRPGCSQCDSGPMDPCLGPSPHGPALYSPYIGPRFARPRSFLKPCPLQEADLVCEWHDIVVEMPYGSTTDHQSTGV